MEYWHVALLGLVQGLTEFLPVSSSGHLVLVGFFLNGQAQPGGALLESLLHVGTALPVLWLFRDQIRGMWGVVRTPTRWRGPRGTQQPDEHWELARFLVIGSVATVVVGLPMLSQLESLYHSPLVVVGGLLATSVLLIASRRLPQTGTGTLGVRQALLVGMAQGIAIVPGVSRSGITLVVGLLTGIPRQRLGASCMLLSVPTILGGALLEQLRHGEDGPGFLPGLIGLLVAGVTGYFAVRWTLAVLVRGRLWMFAPYTFLLASSAWILLSRG